MELFREPSQPPSGVYRVAALGDFDGVHLGHQSVIQLGLKRARETGTCFCLITFNPPLAKIGRGAQEICLLTTVDDKVELFRSLGVHAVWIAHPPRDGLARAPQSLLERYVARGLGATEFATGSVCRSLGPDAPGASALTKVAAQLGIGTLRADAVSMAGGVISSSRVRSLVESARVREAARLLGRPHFVCGIVVHGRGRGRAFGFPSANVSAETECLPPNGVYACRAIFRDASYPAIVSIGPRPTFDDDEKAVEAHIIGFDGDLYGARIKLEVVELLRAQQKFDSPALLARQIERDIIRVGQVLEKY